MTNPKTCSEIIDLYLKIQNVDNFHVERSVEFYKKRNYTLLKLYDSIHKCAQNIDVKSHSYK